MKKRLSFGLTTLALALGAAGLRIWQRQAAYEPDTALPTPGHPATICLVALLALGGLALLALSRWCLRGGELTSYLRAFALPHRGLLTVYLLAGALLVGAGALGLTQVQAGAETQLSRTVLSVCLIPAGLCAALVGWLNTQKREGEGRFAWPLLGPAACACVWLLAAYQSNTADPVVMDYAFALLGAVCAACACYTMASFSFEKPQGMWCLWLCAMGIVLLSTAVADRLSWVTWEENQARLVCLGYMAYLAGQLTCLLTHCEIPAQLEPWRAPADKAEYDVELEESEHE